MAVVVGRSTRSLDSTRRMIKQYDNVRIVSLAVRRPQVSEGFREPRVGDRAVVVELLSSPPGYYLEGFSAEGRTIWVEPFSASEVSLEPIANVANGGLGAV